MIEHAYKYSLKRCIYRKDKEKHNNSQIFLIVFLDVDKKRYNGFNITIRNVESSI